MNSIELVNVTKEYKVFSSPKARLMYSLSRLHRFQPKVFTAVSSVNISIPKGQILGIIGKNGAGKSTILKLITGVSFPTRGEIKVNGRISSLLELGAGFNPELTGMENIYFQADMLGISRQEIEKVVPDILEFADIGDFINQPVKNYSSGMFARLAFATAINVDPEILIVDEVLAVGDIAFQFKCIEKMKEFAKKGVTIIFVTHSMMSLYRFCERAIWIDKGMVVMDGTVEDVVPRYEDNLKRVKSTDLSQSISNEILHVVNSHIESEGMETKDITRGSDFCLSFTYELNETLEENPYIATSIVKDGSNYDIFGIFPTLEAYSLPRERGKYVLQFEFTNQQLNIGEYEMYVSINERNGIGQLYFGRVSQLNVVGETTTLGLVHIDHSVKVQKV